MRYRNLDLEAFDYRLSDGSESFRIRVAESPAGQQKIANADQVTLPADLRKRLRRLDRRRLNLTEMIALGESLAGLLFPPGARSLLDRSRERLDDDEGLRIRLMLDNYGLSDVPWEYAYIPRPDTPPDQKGLEGFLVLDRRISLVRFEIMGQSMVGLDPVTAGPLRMVVLLANPRDPQYTALKLDAERKNLEQTLAEVPELQAEFYPDATVERLEDALTRGVHVFHFSGHGLFQGEMGATFRSQIGEGAIILLDDTGAALLFSAEKLAQNLRGRGVRLAMLGACEAGRRDQLNAWTGVAPALTYAGIPAVVGMQFTIRDENAIAFSRRFYRALAAGQAIDAAMTDGRLAIYNRGQEDERDWGVPVLYLRAEEGVLFPQTAPAALPVERARTTTDPPTARAVYTQRARPAMGGDSLSHDSGGAATLGCLVVDRDQPEAVYILSDYNGLAPVRRQPNVGDPILQPGRADGGSRTGDVIATLARWASVRDHPTGAPTNVSAAIAEVRHLEEVSPQIRGRGVPKGVGEATEGMRVHLVARTSGQVSGKVLRVGAFAEVGCSYYQIVGGTSSTDDENGLFPIPFGDLIECTPMMQPGDSGAILLDDAGRVLGLGFAGGPEVSLFIPIARVLDTLHVNLVTEGVWEALTQ